MFCVEVASISCLLQRRCSREIILLAFAAVCFFKHIEYLFVIIFTVTVGDVKDVTNWMLGCKSNTLGGHRR